MRRLLAILLLVVIGATYAAPFAAAQDPEANLPPCCRSHGKHHCRMSAAMMRRMAEQQSRSPQLVQFGERCPYTPLHTPASCYSGSALPALCSLDADPFASAHLVVARVLARAQSSGEQWHLKRGPPAAFFSL